MSISSGRSSHGQWPASLELDQLGVRQRLGVGAPEARRRCRDRRVPQTTSAGQASRSRPRARRGQRGPGPPSGRAPSDRRPSSAAPALAQIESTNYVRHRPPAAACLAREQPQRGLGRRSRSTSSPSQRSRQSARDPVPAVAGQQRHRVDHDQPLDPLGPALGGDQARPRPSRGRRARARRSRARRGSGRRTREAVHRVVEAVGARRVRAARSRAGRRRSPGPSSRSRNGTQSPSAVGLPWTKTVGGALAARCGGTKMRDAVDVGPLAARRSAGIGADHILTARWRRDERRSGRAGSGPAARGCARSATGCASSTGGRSTTPRPPDRRARPDDPLPEHQRPQSRRRLRAPARRACRPGTRSATRRSRWSRRRSGPAASRHEGAADPGGAARAARRATRLGGRGADPRLARPAPTATRRSPS